METLMSIFWVVVGVAAVGFVFCFIKRKKKKPVEKEISSAPLNTEEPKVEPEMPEMPKDNEEEVEEEEEKEEYKEE